MSFPFHFTFKNLKHQLLAALQAGYQFGTCKDYVFWKAEKKLPKKLIIIRVDIDLSIKKAERLRLIFKELGIKASFFIRLHASEYNPFSFENYRIIRKLIEEGHEIGYHSEIVDQAAIWGEDPVECLKRDLDVMSRMYGIDTKGVASHGGMTGLNNLDFWKTHRPAEFGLLYEAYDREPAFNLFHESFYISDSEWVRWKCYDKGIRKEGDHRPLQNHLADGHPLIYLLIHSDTYFDRHFYE